MEITDLPPDLNPPKVRTQHRIAMWNSLLWLQVDALTLCQNQRAAIVTFDNIIEAESQLALALADQQQEMTQGTEQEGE